MQHVNEMVDEPGPDWGEDTIYCEANCHPEDILYEGSDDEDYDSPTSRRLRYEAAGQRFLDGVEPFLLTASLRGPFDRASGWANPWRSKQRTTRTSQGGNFSPEKAVLQRRHQRGVSIPETTQAETQDSLECHLPSPESLKQAPVAEAHPYLEEDELVMVQNWRSSVQPTSLSKESFWTSTPKENKSIRKRKARGSGWLKKLATKRRRTDIMETGTVNTPIPKRPQTTQSLHETPATVEFDTSFSSAPERLPSSTLRSLPKRQVSNLGIGSQEHDIEDELMEPGHHNHMIISGRSRSPLTRISPRREIQKLDPNDITNDFQDELSQEQIAAAATLSSPVSQRQYSDPPSRTTSKQDSMRESSNRQKLLGAKRSTRNSERDSSASQITNIMVPDVQEKGVSSNQDFETQEDQSFLFRMRPRPAAKDGCDEMSKQSETTHPKGSVSTEKSWSGLSSEAEMSLPNAVDTSFTSFDGGHLNINDIDATMSDAIHGSGEADGADVTSSDLSSLLSEEFEGFDSTAPEHIEPKSDMSDDDFDVVKNIVDTVIEMAVAEQGDGLQQVVSTNIESELTTVLASSSTPEGVAIGMDADTIQSNQHERDESDTSDCSSLTSIGDQAIEALALERKTSRPTAEVTYPKSERAAPIPPRGALLLKTAVRRFVPMSSWAKLSHLRGTSASSPASGAKAKENHDSQPDDASTATDEDSDEDTTTASESECEHDSDSNGDRGGDTSRSKDRMSSNSAHDTETPLVQEAEPAVLPAGDAVDIEEVESQQLPCSQQSPWVGSRLSQFAAMVMSRLSQDVENPDLVATPEKVGKASQMVSGEAQTPWTHDAVKYPMAPKLQLDETIQISPAGGIADITSTLPVESPTQNLGSSVTPGITPRPSTPEPQFSIKSFASFMSPSPERRSRQLGRASWKDSGSRLPSTQGILASATKNPWSANSSRRVSWAPLPREDEGVSTPAMSSDPQHSSQLRGRQASPPPLTPIADLPTGKDSKFHDHFTAVARRTNVLQQRLLPTESQMTVGTPAPQAMAEKFLQVDEVMQHHSEEMEVTGDVEAGYAEDLPKMKNIEASQGSLDIVEDVFREMSDYLETWNVDTDLEQARVETSVQRPQPTPTVQSPW